jgi:hypothetical protein
VPLSEDQLVKLATYDMANPAHALEARAWLDALHRQEFTLRDILGRVLLAAEREAKRDLARSADAGEDGPEPADVEEPADGRPDDGRRVLEALAGTDLARAGSRPVLVSDDDVIAVTRYLSDRIHNQTSGLGLREAHDRAQEMVECARTEAARRRAHTARVAARVLEIVRDEGGGAGAPLDVLTDLRERVESELAAAADR